MKQAALAEAACVGLGGFVGSVLRFAIGGLVHRALPASDFPWGTLTVNATGCLAIGWLSGLCETRQLLGDGPRLFLLAGLLGGFTTFSTFGNETHFLLRGGEPVKAAANVAAHLVLGLSAVWAGHLLSRVV